MYFIMMLFIMSLIYYFIIIHWKLKVNCLHRFENIEVSLAYLSINRYMNIDMPTAQRTLKHSTPSSTK